MATVPFLSAQADLRQVQTLPGTPAQGCTSAQGPRNSKAVSGSFLLAVFSIKKNVVCMVP